MSYKLKAFSESTFSPKTISGRAAIAMSLKIHLFWCKAVRLMLSVVSQAGRRCRIWQHW
jgi:hypothetical protein